MGEDVPRWGKTGPQLLLVEGAHGPTGVRTREEMPLAFLSFRLLEWPRLGHCCDPGRPRGALQEELLPLLGSCSQ